MSVCGGLRAPVFPRGAVALLVLGAGNALAQDALRGKRLFLDAARLTGSGVSCVDCHGGLPGGLFGIGRAANDPAAVERAVNSIPQMSPLRGRLSARDFADLAAYIGNPAVASPALRSATTGPAATVSNERLDFGAVASGARSPSSRWHLINDGSVALIIKSAPQLRGDQLADFSIAASDCVPELILAAGASCSVDLVFRPLATEGGRQAAVAVAHDWVGGEVALALSGQVASAPAVPPTVAASPDGGGGSVAPWILGVMSAVLARRFRRSALADTPSLRRPRQPAPP